MAIFAKFFGCVMTHTIRENAGKIIFLNLSLFSIKDLEYTFVSFLSCKSLYIIYCDQGEGCILDID